MFNISCMLPDTFVYLILFVKPCELCSNDEEMKAFCLVFYIHRKRNGSKSTLQMISWERRGKVKDIYICVSFRSDNH